MGKARTLAQTVSAGGPLADGVPSDVLEFTASGTFTKPAWAQFVMVELWGGGGSGGSGRRGAAGTNRLAGTGGGGGAFNRAVFKASDLAATVSVTVGQGGAGGASVTANSTNGNSGTAGGNSSFGGLVTAFGGGGGSYGYSGLASMVAAAAVAVLLPMAAMAREALAVAAVALRSMAPHPAKAGTAALAWFASTSGNGQKEMSKEVVNAGKNKGDQNAYPRFEGVGGRG